MRRPDNGRSGEQPGPRPEHRRLAELPVAPLLEDGHLILEPLRVVHAGIMVRALSDPGLYKYVGGSPPTEKELRHRFRRRAGERSPEGDERWFNWVVRGRSSVACRGTH
jgi:hypothetical protein